MTVSDGKTSQTVTVRVNDSGALPNIAVEDFDAYVDAETEIPAAIRYNGEIMDVDVAFTAEIADTDIAVFTDGKIRGVSLGQTTATVSTTYKGLELTRRVTITVRENSLIDFGDGIELYAVTGNDETQHADARADVDDNGQKVTDAAVSYRIVEGGEYVTLEAASGRLSAGCRGRSGHRRHLLRRKPHGHGRSGGNGASQLGRRLVHQRQSVRHHLAAGDRYGRRP